jgi:hypothetical protein
MGSFFRKGNLGITSTSTSTIRLLERPEPLVTTSNDKFCLREVPHFPSPLVQYRVSELSEITYMVT